MNPASLPVGLRADAAGNRARIIEAAREAVASGSEVKLNAIARQAGVGQGTLYRHFPTREDLLAEVYREDVDELVAAGPPPLAAPRLGRIGEGLTLLLDAGKADGTIRPDVDARDVILLIGYLTRLEQSEWEARSRPLLQVILDGLRAPGPGRRGRA